MKQFKTTLNLVTILLIAFTIISTTSCKKDGCTDQNAENYDSKADNDDGSCIFARDNYIGSYNVNENCTSGTYSYSLTISQSTTATNLIVINNFGGYNVNIKATVTGNNITFNETADGITFNGSGSLNANTLTIIYTASLGTDSDNCTMTCIKQ